MLVDDAKRFLVNLREFAENTNRLILALEKFVAEEEGVQAGNTTSAVLKEASSKRTTPPTVSKEEPSKRTAPPTAPKEASSKRAAPPTIKSAIFMALDQVAHRGGGLSLDDLTISVATLTGRPYDTESEKYCLLRSVRCEVSRIISDGHIHRIGNKNIVRTVYE